MGLKRGNLYWGGIITFRAYIRDQGGSRVILRWDFKACKTVKIAN